MPYPGGEKSVPQLSVEYASGDAHTGQLFLQPDKHKRKIYAVGGSFTVIEERF